MIPDESVAAATKVAWDRFGSRPDAAYLRAILSAAAPFLFAEEIKSVQKLARAAAWDEGYEAGDEWCEVAVPCGTCEQCKSPSPTNPYRSK